MIFSNLSRSMKCYLHPVLTCPLATDVCLSQKKNSQPNHYHLFATVVMDFKKYPCPGRLVKMSKIRVVNQQYHKDFFSLMWIKSRFIEVSSQDLENQWIADGKKTSLPFWECEMMWFDAIPVKLEDGIWIKRLFGSEVDTAETAFQQRGCFSAVCS